MAVTNGLEGVVAAQTDLSLVDGQNGILVYRGYYARDLAIHHSFEEVAHLLWYGHLPDAAELDKLKQAFLNHRIIPVHVQSVIDAIPHDVDMMSALRTAISAMGRQGAGLAAHSR